MPVNKLLCHLCFHYFEMNLEMKIVFWKEIIDWWPLVPVLCTATQGGQKQAQFQRYQGTFCFLNPTVSHLHLVCCPWWPTILENFIFLLRREFSSLSVGVLTLLTIAVIKTSNARGSLLHCLYLLWLDPQPPGNYLVTIDRIYKAPSVYEVSCDTQMLTNYQLFPTSSEFLGCKQQKVTLANSIGKDCIKGYNGAHRIDRKARDPAEKKSGSPERFEEI